MIGLLSFALAAAPLSAEGSNRDQVIEATVFPDPQRVEGVHLVVAQEAIARFFRANDPHCFRVYFGVDQSGREHQVDFVSKRQRVIIVEDGERPPVDPFARCGTSWTYILDGRGRVLRKFIPR